MGKCVFNEDWLAEPKYKLWLQKAVGDKHKASCKICKKTFDIGNMGSAGVDSHMKSKKHKKLLTSTAKGANKPQS
jgi:hypothetical protein